MRLDLPSVSRIDFEKAIAFMKTADFDMRATQMRDRIFAGETLTLRQVAEIIGVPERVAFEFAKIEIDPNIICHPDIAFTLIPAERAVN
jgi:hypothetical protein